MTYFLRRYGDVLFTGLLLLVFALEPRLDLHLAAWFYRPGSGFPLENLWWVRAIYRIVSNMWVLAVVWLALLLAGYLPGLRAHWAPRRRLLAYLLAVLLLGPGLIVNTGFKDNWGRARPAHLVEFGGSAHYSPPLIPSDQCRRNCSFVSGHASASFYVMVGFWVTRRRRWLIGGIVLGLSLGFIRMAMGGHFLSDILFAGVIVHFTCRLLAEAFRLPAPGDSANKNPA